MRCWQSESNASFEQLLNDTNWHDLDYLVVDLPPGTGDIQLTLCQRIPVSGAVIVTTPQDIALLDARKGLKMFEKVNVPVLGIVENMTGDIFGRGGAQEQAEKSGVPFLGEVPIDASIRELGDAGRMADVLGDDCPVREDLRKVCQNIAMQIAKETLEAPELPTLEVL